MTLLPWISVTLLELVSFPVEKEIAGVSIRPEIGRSHRSPTGKRSEMPEAREDEPDEK